MLGTNKERDRPAPGQESLESQSNQYNDEIEKAIGRWFRAGLDRALGVEKGEERRQQAIRLAHSLWSDYKAGWLSWGDVVRRVSELEDDDPFKGRVVDLILLNRRCKE